LIAVAKKSLGAIKGCAGLGVNEIVSGRYKITKVSCGVKQPDLLMRRFEAFRELD